MIQTETNLKIYISQFVCFKVALPANTGNVVTV